MVSFPGGGFQSPVLFKTLKILKMKTKYIKVSTADRPPATITKIITLRDCKLESSMLSESGNWYSFESESEIETPEYWFEEKPDYEEEMLEEIKTLIKTLKIVSPYRVSGEIIDHAEKLVKEATELK